MSASNLKRCPRCETEKHKSEFSSMGYCRPCGRDYARERSATQAQKAGKPPPKPRSSPVAVAGSDIVAGDTIMVDTVAEPALATSIKQLADKVSAPKVATSAGVTTERVTLPLDEQTRRRIIARQLSAELLAVLNSGEQLTLVATRVGSGLLIDTLQLDAVLL